MTTTLAAPMDWRPVVRFLRTPKGLLLAIFAGLLALSCIGTDANVAISRIVVAASTAAIVDLALNYLRHRRWVLPDGAIITGMIVAFVLRPQESWLVLIVTVVLAILSKHALRTRWSNIFNPAALALVAVAVFLNTDQSWWGALPDMGILGAVVLLVAGGLIADRINKLPMILAFLGTYFALFSLASVNRSSTVSEIFLTPDLQAAVFFAFFMLDDPPTSPVRHPDQVVFGVIVATVGYFVFMHFGGVYFLPAGLLAGNLWESSRRVVASRVRNGNASGARVDNRGRLRLAGSVGMAAVALPLIFASGVLATGGSEVADSGDPLQASAQSVSSATTPATTQLANVRYPFLSSFENDFNGSYAQTNDASSAHLVLDGLATGDLTFGVHVELIQQSVVPPPDDESSESTPDDEEQEAQPRVMTTVNKAQIVDPDSKGLLCDGKLTALSRGSLRFSCDGASEYLGVQMQIASQLDAAGDGNFSGAMSGVMRRGD